MWLLFLPVLFCLFVLMAAGLLIGGAVWMLHAGWPWLLIAIGVWMLWRPEERQFRKHRRNHARGWGGATYIPSSAPRTHDVGSAPPSSQPRPARQTELPIDLQVKVEQIRRKVDVLLGYADRFPPFSRDLFLVQQTASEYLPRTIEAFLSLSREAADKPLVGTSKTAREELRAQLDLLDSKLDEIAQDLQRQDADRLLANRRFLESRFGMRDKPQVA